MRRQWTPGRSGANRRVAAQLSLATVLLASIAVPAAGAGEPGQPSSARLKAALDEAIERPDARAALALEVECTRDGQLPAVAIFGRGVGIWEGRRQFALSAPQVTTLLRDVRDSGFARFPASFGESAERDAALKVICRVTVELGGWRKQVVQFEKGQQSAELRRLADRIYALCEPASRQGMEAESLEDGLEKIARGELAPETFGLMLHRKPELGATEASPGLLLRLSGRTLTVRSFDRSAGYGEPRTVLLETSDLEALVGELAARHPGRLPANLWAADYTDFELAVLDRKVAVQARRFTGMTHATHGEPQLDFDAILAAVGALQQRLLPVAAQAPETGR